MCRRFAELVFVDFPENPDDHALPANLGGIFSLGDLEDAARKGTGVVLLFEDQDPCRPVVVGLVRAPSEAFKKIRIQADEIVIEGKKNVVVRTGESGLRLNQNEAAIKGKQVVSKAKNQNRIQGGAVSIN